MSLHTSPLDLPGRGDAGGMNVYVAQLARQLVAQGEQVIMYALRRRSDQAAVVDLPDGSRVHHLDLGAIGRAKEDLPAYVDAFAAACGDLVAADPSPGILHAHYWLSAVAGRQIAARTGLRLVTCLHTTARAKNERRGPGDVIEPESRARAEQAVIAETDALVVNTVAEGEQLTRLYAADPARIAVIAPGIDPEIHHPPSPDPRDMVARDPMRVLLAGRLQSLKGPQVLIAALALLRDSGRDVVARIIGDGAPEFVAGLRAQIAAAALTDRVELLPSRPAAALAEQMRAADVVAVPSSSETFGLVALEAQGCATPVVATRVDGLEVAVRDGRTGLLVDSRDPAAWAAALGALADDPARRRTLGRAGAAYAAGHSWARVAREHRALYARLTRAATAAQ
ncbi:glycosyltransferase [Granulicoccus phenolivorans]|uniref:glycosyltransferase n=1 Tax=Granulicoccus phenolivorans TaxID=266854 RepID=UPI00068611A7|nr:glycosyltransferase [Granulicoccus phenolivorans]